MSETLAFKPGTRSGAVVSAQPCAQVHQTRESGHADLEYYGGYMVAESVPPELVPLLTAAPDLLEACKRVENDLRTLSMISGQDHERMTTLLSDAIAKAEGRA